MKNLIIQNRKTDTSFKVIFGGIAFIFGLATLHMYIGIMFLLIAIIIAFYNSGIEFSLNDNKVRSFYSLFGVKKGAWETLKKYYCISIKRTRKGYRTHSRANTSSIDTINTKFEVFLMGKIHKDSILLYDSSNKHEVISFAKDLCKKLEFELKPYGKK